MPLEAFYLPTPAGQRFCLLSRPVSEQPCHGAVIFVHAFAEEQNKSRRMAMLHAKGLAERGFLVLQIDLHGCGDSDGDFGDATWATWVEDIVFAHAWLTQNGNTTIWLWGLRAGCLIAADAARRITQPINMLFWQPVVSGKQFLQQFLRLQAAGEIFGREGKGSLDRQRDQLNQGGSIEVAGYCLSAELVSGLEQSDLSPPSLRGQLVWLQLSNRPDGVLPPQAVSRLEQWQTAGFSVRSAVISGPAFWQTTEITDCPSLLEASIEALVQEVTPR